MKTRTTLWGAILTALLASVVATLLGGLVSNPTGYEGLSGAKSVYIDSESYGWPVPWRIDSNAADEAGVGTGGVSISSFVFSMALWFWPVFAAILVSYAIIHKRWIADFSGLQIACLAAFGIASLATILGTLSTSTGTWQSGRGFEINYESAGWPFEWKTNPALPVTSSIYEDEAQSYHETMQPYKVLGYSPAWLAFNFVVCAILAAVAEFLVAALVMTALWSRRHLLGSGFPPSSA